MSSIFDDIRYGKPPTYKMFIGGKWVKSSTNQAFDVLNPFDNSIVGKVQKASIKDAELSVKKALLAKKIIADMPSVDRASILDKAADLMDKYKEELIRTIVAEAGKPVNDANSEVTASISRIRIAEDEAKEIRGESIKSDIATRGKKKIGIVVRQPLGIILAISPFNYPLFAPVAKIAPAIAAGNAVISKPASDDPICMLLFAKILQEAGVPEGALNVLTGSSSEIGDYLIKHEKIDMVSFTGSSAVGKHVASVAGMKRLQLELGGKCPAIVLEDADIDLAAKECVTGSLKFSGQRCDAISRILVVNSVADKFVKKVLKETKKWKVGNPKNPKTLIGPLINEKAVIKVKELVDDARKKGARLLTGGRVNGLCFEPTVLDNVNKKMKITWEETFGPVVTIMRIKNYEEGIKIANMSNYGLDACIFTRDLNRAFDAALRLEDGSVHINVHPTHGVGVFPFGGDKDSGIGREGIRYSIREMTKPHTVVLSK